MLPRTELDVSSEEDGIIGLPLAARVTWAVPEFVVIFIASVGKGKCVPLRKREIGAGQRRGTLQDIPPPDEDSEDEDSDEDGEQLYQAY